MSGSGSGQLRCGSLQARDLAEVNAVFSQGYNYEFTQTGPAGSGAVSSSFILGLRAMLTHDRYDASMHALGSLRGNFFGLCLVSTPHGPRCPNQWWGRPLGREAPTTLSGEVLDFTVEPGTCHTAIFFDVTVLRRVFARSSMRQDALDALQPGRVRRTLQVDKAARRRLVSLCPGGRGGDWDTVGSMTPERFERLILGHFLELLDTSQASVAATASRYALVSRATDLHEDAGAYRMPAVADLCQSLQVSPRTLEVAFKACTGLSPKTYFMRRQLGKARSLLMNAHAAEMTVTAAALATGFLHMGRFSVRYRQMFGETPSQTLQRRPRPTVTIPFRQAASAAGVSPRLAHGVVAGRLPS